MTEKAQMTSVTTIVEAVNLKKTYMIGKVPVNALRGVNLRVESDDFLAVLGHSGSGKSCSELSIFNSLCPTLLASGNSDCSNRAKKRLAKLLKRLCNL